MKYFASGLHKSNGRGKAGHHSVNALVQECGQQSVALGQRIQKQLGRELELSVGYMMGGGLWSLTGEEGSVAVWLYGKLLNVEFFPVTKGNARKKTFESFHVLICSYLKGYEVGDPQTDYYLISSSAV